MSILTKFIACIVTVAQCRASPTWRHSNMYLMCPTDRKWLRSFPNTQSVPSLMSAWKMHTCNAHTHSQGCQCVALGRGRARHNMCPEACRLAHSRDGIHCQCSLALPPCSRARAWRKLPHFLAHQVRTLTSRLVPVVTGPCIQCTCVHMRHCTEERPALVAISCSLFCMCRKICENDCDRYARSSPHGEMEQHVCMYLS